MQTYTYEKAMAQETRNGGTSAFGSGNNNNGVDNSKKKLLVALDVLCLLLGESTGRSLRPLHLFAIRPLEARPHSKRASAEFKGHNNDNSGVEIPRFGDKSLITVELRGYL